MPPLPIEQLKREAEAAPFFDPPGEVFVVYERQFFRRSFVATHAFPTSKDAWAYVRQRAEDIGRSSTTFRVIAREADPDLEAMITAPAATVAGSMNLLDATLAALHRHALLKPTCDEAGNWRYVPAAEIDGARVPAAAIAAVSLDQTLLDTVASALDIPADPARAAVEGEAA